MFAALMKRNEPRAMLIGNRDRSGAGDDQRNPLFDHLLHRIINAPQIGAAESRKSSLKYLAQIRHSVTGLPVTGAPISPFALEHLLIEIAP